eukprot:11194338-Lingulodinium_polyedra.AAC.1
MRQLAPAGPTRSRGTANQTLAARGPTGAPLARARALPRTSAPATTGTHGAERPWPTTTPP